MKRITYRNLLAIMALTGGFIPVTATNISVNPNVNPENGYVGEPFGQITIFWPGVNLEMENSDPDLTNVLDPSCVSITLNGEKVTLGSSMMEGRVMVKRMKESQEQNGGGEQTYFDAFIIQFPDMYFFWKGELNVSIEEGAVISVSGETNAPLNLSYVFTETVNDIIWEPSMEYDGSNVVFEQGKCVIYACWEGYSQPQLNPNPAIEPFYQKEDPNNNDKLGDHISAVEYMSVEEGKIKFDFTGFEPGIYVLDLTAGSVILEEGISNGEQTYNFEIREGVVDPDYFVTALPSELDWFDGFGVIWGEEMNQPYEISSEYAVLNEDSGYYIFNDEGLSLFSVKVNGTDELEILQVSITEYQEDTDSPNYPSSRLVVTLADLQTNVGERYSLIIPAGIIKIETGDGNIAFNGEVTYSFTLQATEAFQLPTPMIDPEQGSVETLESISICWEGTLGGLDLLKLNETNEEASVTVDGKIYEDFEISFEWSSHSAMTDDADGDILMINFAEPITSGEVEINIPTDFIRVTDIDEGTLNNEPIHLFYNVGNDTGVNLIKGDNSSVNVFKLDGTRVLDSLDKTEIKNLPSGLYIINGKKIMIGK